MSAAGSGQYVYNADGIDTALSMVKSTNANNQSLFEEIGVEYNKTQDLGSGRTSNSAVEFNAKNQGVQADHQESITRGEQNINTHHQEIQGADTLHSSWV